MIDYWILPYIIGKAVRKGASPCIYFLDLRMHIGYTSQFQFLLSLFVFDDIIRVKPYINIPLFLL